MEDSAGPLCCVSGKFVMMVCCIVALVAASGSLFHCGWLGVKFRQATRGSSEWKFRFRRCRVLRPPVHVEVLVGGA